ncbi:unnamed protein product [Onchocerca flexuosa]|uniref:Transposase n=1 Tax=Onchocerca flexuosa TaxID=387005 RepID=A0A183GYA5_9BILA|nr:unnamed protein product [Onchocerca flexuosa]
MKKLKPVISHIRTDIKRRMNWNAKYANEIIEFISEKKYLQGNENALLANIICKS